MPIKKLKLEKLIVDAGTDVRNQINEETVDEYGLAAKGKAKLPPLIVFETSDGLLLADGFHRYYGFERQGINEYDCDVRKGNRLDAIKFALGCNTTHGLRRTNADKRNAVIISFKEFPKLSNRATADICAVAPDLVDRMRQESDEETEREKLSQVPFKGTSNPVTPSESKEETLTPPPRRTGKDGKSYPVPQRPAEPKKPDTMDATGLAVPEEIVPFWDSAFEEAERLLTLTSEIRTRIKRAQDTNEPIFREVDHTDILAKLDQVYVDLKRAKPYAVCPDCNGIPKGGATAFAKSGKIGGCGTCKGRGFVSEFFWSHAVPVEKKTITGRA